MSSAVTQLRLTKYPTASLRELLNLCLPLILSLFSASFMGFCNRLFLAHYSLPDLEGCASAAYLCYVFQQPCIRLTSSAQIFVGYLHGSGQTEKIGSYIWQMIWLSLLTLVITLPISQVAGPLFYAGTAIEAPALSYFSIMMYGNFLFPLGAALSSFFIGRGKTRIIFLSAFGSQCLNLLLDYLLIFGVEGWIPSLGIVGAAIANTTSQAIFCAVLLYYFLKKSGRGAFGTMNFSLNRETLWQCCKVGLPRAFARIVLLAAWVASAHIITLKGGDFLMVLSFGGSLILLFTFINDGMLQGMITVTSNIIGSKQFALIWKMVRSASILLTCTTVLVAIPYLIFPDWMLTSFFTTTATTPENIKILKRACIWLWVFFFTYGFNTIGLSIITAARDMKFYMLVISLTWATSYLPVYLAFEVWNLSPDYLWLIMAFDSFALGWVYLLRSRKEKWKLPDQASIQEISYNCS